MHHLLKKEDRFEKKLIISFFALLIIIVTAACSTYKTITFPLENKDEISIKLETSNKYDIDANVPFTISKEGKILTEGKFITLDAYDQYLSVIDSGIDATLIKRGDKAGIKYVFYSHKNEESESYNYVIGIEGSDTGIILVNNISQETAEDCFNHLTISLEKHI